MAISQRWKRVILVVLGVPNVITGLWALVDPDGWYESFPGWAPHLVAAYPPFNGHLASDAGAGLLASGCVVLIAAIWPRSDIILTATTAFLLFALPHAMFHLFNSAPENRLTTAESVQSTGTLVVAAGLGVIVLVSEWRNR